MKLCLHRGIHQKNLPIMQYYILATKFTNYSHRSHDDQGMYVFQYLEFHCSCQFTQYMSQLISENMFYVT